MITKLVKTLPTVTFQINISSQQQQTLTIQFVNFTPGYITDKSLVHWQHLLCSSTTLAFQTTYKIYNTTTTLRKLCTVHATAYKNHFHKLRGWSTHIWKCNTDNYSLKTRHRPNFFSFFVLKMANFWLTNSARQSKEWFIHGIYINP